MSSCWRRLGLRTASPALRKHKMFAVITLKFGHGGITRVMHPKDADEMANSVDSDQTAPLVVI